MITSYCINLKESKNRLDSFLKNFPPLPTIDLEIIEAYDGRKASFPFYKYKKYSKVYWANRKGKNDFKPGAFCCYLSHAKAWRNFLQKKNARYAFIFEDDALISSDRLTDFLNEDFPKDFDVIFINDQVVDWLNLTNHTNKEIFTNIAIPFKEFASNYSYKNIVPSIGSYGYFFSKNGAKKLLKMMHLRGICMGIDYAIILNSLSKKDITSIQRNEILNSKLLDLFLNKVRLSSTKIEDISLSSFIYQKAIVSHKHTASDIHHNTLISTDVFDSV